MVGEMKQFLIILIFVFAILFLLDVVIMVALQIARKWRPEHHDLNVLWERIEQFEEERRQREKGK